MNILSPNCLLSQPKQIVSAWYKTAVKELVETGRIPDSDEVWVNQNYLEKIMFFAQELFEDSLQIKAQ